MSVVLNGTSGVSFPDATTQATSASMVLVATLDTSSAATVAATNIASFSFITLVFAGVSSTSTGMSVGISLSSNNGAAYGTVVTMTDATGSAAATLYGSVVVYATNLVGIVKPMAGNAAQLTATGSNNRTPYVGIDTATTGVINAIKFTPSAGTFDAGAIYVYGTP